MQPFWDVLWTDTWALARFVVPMIALTVPVSILAVLVGAMVFRFDQWRKLLVAAIYGAIGGALVALALSMLMEYELKVEGFFNGRRAMQDAATWQLIVAAPIAASAITFIAIRRMALQVREKTDRRFSLRLLFIGQFVAALLLGWWAYTRRDEIRQQRTLLEWQSLDQQHRTAFEPLGWHIDTAPGSNEVLVRADPHLRVIADEALIPIASHESVTYVMVESDQITDRGLSHLRGANRLRRVTIKSPQVTDQGIEGLSQLPRLRYLEIYCPKVSGKCLKSLAEVRTLRYLVIQSEHVSEQEEAEFRAARPGVDVRILRQ